MAAQRMRNPYTVLDLPNSATQAEIKTRYRKLAKQYHPDRQSGDDKAAEHFKEVTAAHEVLGDAKLRSRFDRGEIDAAGNECAVFQQTGSDAGATGFGNFSFVDFEDLLSPLFGGRAHAGRPQSAPKYKGANTTRRMNVKFMEAALGAKRRLKIDGRRIEVSVPAGIESGKTIRLRGQGGPGSNGGPPGDLLIRVDVGSHPSFVRSGVDISVDLPVTLGEAVLGARIDVPTIHGPVSLTIPKGSNTGTKLRLKGKGIHRPGRKAGDQYVRLEVVLPERSDPALADFVSRWGQEHPYDPRAGLKL